MPPLRWGCTRCLSRSDRHFQTAPNSKWLFSAPLTLTSHLNTPSLHLRCCSIQRRLVFAPVFGESQGLVSSSPAQMSATLSESQQRWVGSADTFFLGTAMRRLKSADMSHRGGKPGFVRVLSPTKLVFPDYYGNGQGNPPSHVLNAHTYLLTHLLLLLLLLLLQTSKHVYFSGEHCVISTVRHGVCGFREWAHSPAEWAGRDSIHH